MFTGIVTSLGAVRRIRMRGGLLDLEIEAPEIARELKVGDSVAVNGVCLTATTASRKRFAAQAMEETLALTALGSLEKGNEVNLELAARPTDRLGGHFVQGHIDGVARVVRIEDEEGARRVWLQPREDLLRYMVPKGSVALDGVALTIVEVGRATFQVALIPHTLEVTWFKDLIVGSKLNIEVDVIAKYVEKLTAAFDQDAL